MSVNFLKSGSSFDEDFWLKIAFESEKLRAWIRTERWPKERVTALVLDVFDATDGAAEIFDAGRELRRPNCKDLTSRAFMMGVARFAPMVHTEHTHTKTRRLEKNRAARFG